MQFVNQCPTSLSEVKEASKRLHCGEDQFGNNQYMCLPNAEKTSLVEFCFEGIMGAQEKGYCLKVNTTDGNLSTERCIDFKNGCPDNHYWNHQFFKYPACQNVDRKHQCYLLQPSCPPTTNASYDDINVNTTYQNIFFYVVPPLAFFVILVLLIWVFKTMRRRSRQQSQTEWFQEDSWDDFEDFDSYMLDRDSREYPTYEEDNLGLLVSRKRLRKI